MRLLIALAVVCSWTIRAAAGEAAHSCSWTLGTAADLDQASPTHFVTADRVGDTGESDGATFRAMKPDQYQIIWTMPAFDIATEYGAIAHVFYLTVRYRDLASTPMSLWAGHGGEGFYGKVIIGSIGGSGDGAWKEETLVIPRSMLRSGDGKAFTFAITDLKAAVPIASIVLFSADSALPDRDQRIVAAQALQRTKRAAARAQAASKIHDLGLPDPGPVVAPTADESKRGWRVFFPSISRQLFANSQPRSEEATCVVRACPGETRSVVIALSPLKDLGALTIACSDLTTAGGAVAWSREPVRWARYSLQKVGSSWSDDYRECPEQLSLAAPEGVSGRLAIACVEVRVPSALKAGTYSGTVIVTAGGASQSIPVSLEVYPFGLQHPDHATHGIFYYCDYADMSPYDLLDMRDHGIDMLVAGLLPKMSAGTDHTVAIDATQVRAGFAMLKRMGYRSPMVCSNGGLITLVKSYAQVADGSPEHHLAYASVLSAVMEAAKQEGFERTAFFPVDEPHTDPLIAEALTNCTWIRECPGARTYITSNPKAVGVLQPVLDDVGYNLVYIKPAIPDAVAKAGATLMFYTSSVDTNPEPDRFRAGFYFAKLGAEAMQFFAYSLFEVDPFADFDGSHRDWNVVYPSMDGPTHDPTLEWQALREGVDDYRYAYTLRTLAEAARAAGRSAQADEALRVLDEVLAPIDIDGEHAATPEQAIEANVALKDTRIDPATLGGERMPGSWYESSRRRIAAAIIRLRGAAK